MTEDSQAATQWQERTVERSLKAARQRAISKGNAFIAAAAELLRTTGKADFTVQEVVDRSGMSLRSFYQHFGSKDDLLLALVEETVHNHAEGARRCAQVETDPVSQLRAFVLAMFGSAETDDAASRGLVLFHWHLAEARTDEYAATIQPYIDTVVEILVPGVAQGRFRRDLAVPEMAAILIHTLVSVLDMRVLGVLAASEDVSAEALVSWCLAAVAEPSGRAKR
jgi:AcrR family transcriptional regulator